MSFFTAVKVTDGTNIAAVKAASTPPVVADPALVVAISPNTPALSISGTVTANQGGAPWSQNLTQLNSVALGSPSTYGTSPGAVNVIGVNAFITNTPAVTLASTTITGTVAVTQSTSPWVVSGTVTANQGGSPWSVTFPSAQPVSIASLPLPSNAAQETGNLAQLVVQTRNDAQIIDLLAQLLAQAKYNNMLLASSSTAGMDDPDTIACTLIQ